jgi:hypothetical protein
MEAVQRVSHGDERRHAGLMATMAIASDFRSWQMD